VRTWTAVSSVGNVGTADRGDATSSAMVGVCACDVCCEPCCDVWQDDLLVAGRVSN
jgi:hypothetical protein